MIPLIAEGALRYSQKTWFYVLCLGQAVLIKQFAYKFYGHIYGLEALGAIDDFWLYDSEINPVNVPSFIVFDKPDVKPEEFIQRFQKNLRGHRCGVKLVKFWGKYFFEKLNDEEWEYAKKNNMGIKADITTEKEAIDFALKLKSLSVKDSTKSTVRGYYFPNLNNGKEAAIMCLGHHSHQDGIS